MFDGQRGHDPELREPRKVELPPFARTQFPNSEGEFQVAIGARDRPVVTSSSVFSVTIKIATHRLIVLLLHFLDAFLEPFRRTDA